MSALRRDALYKGGEGFRLRFPKRRFKWTGDVRCPKKGEWFLSGAEVEAYKAFSDLETLHPIAVEAEPQETVCKACRRPL